MNRIYPTLCSDRYYILTLLREIIEAIATRYLVGGNPSIVVDMGCGTMPYKPIFEKHGVRYIGVDLPSNEGAEVHLDSNGRTSLPDGFADFILSTQVLEHVDSPDQYLGECYRILKPGGVLVLSTHGYWMYHPDPKDLWRWTNEGLKRVIHRAGFRIVDFQGVMGLAPTAVQLLQDALMPKTPRFIKPLFSLIMQRFAMVADKFHLPSERAQDACIFVVIASKGGLN